jgi:Transposase DDE domain
VEGAEVDFPFAAQIARLDRWTDRGQGTIHQETVFLVTSLWPDQADEWDLHRLARGHWSIENALHWCRDWNWDEDRCPIRNPNGARVMASLRNLAIGYYRWERRGAQKTASIASRQRHFAAHNGHALKCITDPWPAGPQLANPS